MRGSRTAAPARDDPLPPLRLAKELLRLGLWRAAGAKPTQAAKTLRRYCRDGVGGVHLGRWLGHGWVASVNDWLAFNDAVGGTKRRRRAAAADATTPREWAAQDALDDELARHFGVG